MSEWNNIKLKEICNLITAKTAIENASIDNYISTENMLPNFCGISLAEKIPKTPSVNTFKPGDVLFSNIRTYFKKVWFALFYGTVSQDVLVFRANNYCDNKFLYYLLCEPSFTEYSVLTSKGAKMPRGDKDAILNYSIFLPPITEQKAIASVLSSLDDKIDLLHRQNKTLESMAETLFRQWFVVEAQDDWAIYKLGDLTDISIGRTPPRKESHWFSNNSNDIKWLSIKDMADSGVYRTNTNEFLPLITIETFKIPIIPIDTVVLSFKMTVGRVGITSENMVSNEAIAQFKIKRIITTEFLYCFLKSFNYDTLGTTSTIVTSINTALIKSISLRIPNESRVQEFTLKTSPLFLKIKKNQKQLCCLEKLRDTLLPKLMSGEVRVKLD